MTTLYIAGPMTGYEDHNIPAFNAAEKRLRALGYDVLNPARNEGNASTWQGYMRLGIQDVLHADGICVLPNWQRSRGALIEVDVADVIGIPVLTEDLWRNRTRVTT